MRNTISATDLARRLGEVLGRIRFRNESFLIERHGTPVARIGPLSSASPANVGEALAAWGGASRPDPEFADDLQRVNSADLPPVDPWVS